MSDPMKINLNDVKCAVVEPKQPKDLAIIYITGFLGRHTQHLPYFSQVIGEKYPICTVETRHRGLARGKSMVNDICHLDQIMRDRFETDNIVYFGHSMGLPLALEAAHEHERNIKGYFGMSVYPNYGQCLGSFFHSQIIENVIDWIGKSNFGPFAYPLKDTYTSRPMRIVLGKEDEVVWTRYRVVRDRFKIEFKKLFPNVQVKIIPGNHCFNNKPFDHTYFNKDHPKALINEAMNFLEYCK